MDGLRMVMKVLWKVCETRRRHTWIICNLHEMHALVLGLFEESMDPARVSSLESKR